MYNRCVNCDEIIQDGELVKVMVKSIYRRLPSKIAYAIEKPTDCIDGTLQHEECTKYV